MTEWVIWEARHYVHTVEADTLADAIELASNRSGQFEGSAYATGEMFNENRWDDDFDSEVIASVTNPEWDGTNDRTVTED